MTPEFMQTITPDKAAATTPVIAIVGPTATGKTAFAVAVAKAAGRLVLSPTRTYAPVIKQLLEQMRPAIHGATCTYGSLPW